MIALALACQPKLLIADEPTTALDVTIQAQILELIKDLNQQLNMGIILITHDLGVIAQMAQTVAVMYAGRIVEYAGVEELFGDPRHPYTRGLMDSIPRMGEDTSVKDRMLKAIPGVVPNLVGLPEGCTFAERCPHAMSVCRSRFPTLYVAKPHHKVACWLYGQ